MRLTYLNTYQALIYEYSLELNITTIWSLYLKQRKVNHYNNHNEKKQEEGGGVGLGQALCGGLGTSSS